MHCRFDNLLFCPISLGDLYIAQLWYPLGFSHSAELIPSLTREQQQSDFYVFFSSPKDPSSSCPFLSSCISGVNLTSTPQCMSSSPLLKEINPETFYIPGNPFPLVIALLTNATLWTRGRLYTWFLSWSSSPHPVFLITPDMGLGCRSFGFLLPSDTSSRLPHNLRVLAFMY